MADHYLEFSETLTHLTDEQIDWLQNQLETVHVIDGVEYTEDELPDTGDGAWIGCRAYRDMKDCDAGFGEDVGFDYSFHENENENTGRHLWIHSEEHGYVDRVAHLVQKFLGKFRSDACWSLTYAGTCSKPRVGEFGAGAFSSPLRRSSIAMLGDSLRNKRNGTGCRRISRGLSARQTNWGFSLKTWTKRYTMRRAVWPRRSTTRAWTNKFHGWSTNWGSATLKRVSKPLPNRRPKRTPTTTQRETIDHVRLLPTILGIPCRLDWRGMRVAARAIGNRLHRRRCRVS